jgi:putative transposase
MVLDLFSRYIVAWMVSSKENSALASQLITEASCRYGIAHHQLTVHQDRGSPMTAHRYIDQMVDLGIGLSHSRPRVSNDNPFSESQFKTQKYQPDFPGRFHSASHARQWYADYVPWYDFEHHHSGLAGYTPAQVFTGQWKEVAAIKQRTMDAAYLAHPERFVAGPPVVKSPPKIVTINPVTPEDLAEGATDQVNFPTLPIVKHKLSANRSYL